MDSDIVVADIEKRCRFVFNHMGGRIGLTTDGTLVQEARNALLSVRSYNRAPGIPEWEIFLRPQVILETEE